MAARMPDLALHSPIVVPISNTLRRRAALALAEQHPTPQRLAYYLVQLGLATHQPDGTFTSTPDADGVCWFTREDPAAPAFRLAVNTLDDYRP